MRTKTVYLIRHALPDFGSGERVYLGKSIDLPLGAEGRSQADWLAERLHDVPLDAVFTSPLLRARQTAAPLERDHGCPCLVLDSLKELSCGDWEGRSISEVHREYSSFFQPGGHFAPPNGESDEHGLQRIRECLSVFEQTEGTTFAAVGHSGLFRLLMADLTGLPLNEKRSFRFGYADFHLVIRQGGVWKTVSEERKETIP